MNMAMKFLYRDSETGFLKLPLSESISCRQYLRQTEKTIFMVVGFRRKTQEMRWVLLRSTQPTKMACGTGILPVMRNQVSKPLIYPYN
jgi:hypothetical protein